MADLQTAFRDLARAYGTTTRLEHGALVFEVWQDGVLLVLRLRPSGGGAELALGAEGVSLPAIRAYFSDGLELLSQRLRLSPRLRTGDPPFDDRVQLETGLPATALRELAGHADLRGGILALLGHGTPVVELGSGGLLARFPVRPAERLAPEQVAPLLEPAARIVASMRGTDPAWALRRQSRWPSWLAAALFGTGALAALTFWLAHLLFEPTHWHHVAFALAAGTLPWAAVVPFLALALRGRTDALAQLVLSGTFLLTTLVLGTGTGLVVYNAVYDASEPIEHRAIVRDVESRTVRSGRRTDRYERRLWVTASQGEHRWRVLAPTATSADLELGSPITISTRSGALGWEWGARAR